MCQMRKGDLNRLRVLEADWENSNCVNPFSMMEKIQTI